MGGLARVAAPNVRPRVYLVVHRHRGRRSRRRSIPKHLLVGACLSAIVFDSPLPYSDWHTLLGELRDGLSDYRRRLLRFGLGRDKAGCSVVTRLRSLPLKSRVWNIKPFFSELPKSLSLWPDFPGWSSRCAARLPVTGIRAIFGR